jgi:hypothetical protein
MDMSTSISTSVYESTNCSYKMSDALIVSPTSTTLLDVSGLVGSRCGSNPTHRRQATPHISSCINVIEDDDDDDNEVNSGAEDNVDTVDNIVVEDIELDDAEAHEEEFEVSTPTREIVKKVSFSEEKPTIHIIDNIISNINPLVAFLIQESQQALCGDSDEMVMGMGMGTCLMSTQREVEHFFRLSLSRIIGVVPGLTEYSVERYGSLWRKVIDAFQAGRIDEDIHTLVTEIWPYIAAPVSISRNGEMCRVWKLQYFWELCNDF